MELATGSARARQLIQSVLRRFFCGKEDKVDRRERAFPLAAARRRFFGTVRLAVFYWIAAGAAPKPMMLLTKHLENSSSCFAKSDVDSSWKVTHRKESRRSQYA